MGIRNRAEGWKHAKLSGHQNEETIKDLLSYDKDFQTAFLNRLGKESCNITYVDVGGLKEKNVPSILGGTTKSKVDLKVAVDDGTIFKISIKKSLGGQVYLIGIKHFINGYEKHYSKIPDDVKRAIELFWGSAADTKILINEFGTNKNYENRKHRLVAESIKNYNIELYDVLLNWFTKNTIHLFDFCFSKGLAQEEKDWANLIWYINRSKEHVEDEIFSMDDISTSLKIKSNSLTSYGNTNGGTTIQLPFGFVQWHSPQKIIPGSIQFHHKFEKIKLLLEK